MPLLPYSSKAILWRPVPSALAPCVITGRRLVSFSLSPLSHRPLPPSLLTPIHFRTFGSFAHLPRPRLSLSFPIQHRSPGFSRLFSQPSSPPSPPLPPHFPPQAPLSLRFRLRKLLMRNHIRPFNMDDIFAMFSWLLFGNVLFILVGTTTFVSLLLFLGNSLQFQEYIATWLGAYLTRETGIEVRFESAIVPDWRRGLIRLKRVGVKSDASAGLDVLFDLHIDEIELTVSLVKFLEGRGWIETCAIQGVRGTVDRRALKDRPIWHYDHRDGDFDIGSLRVRDVDLWIENPSAWRSYAFRILQAELPRFRKDWMLYDICRATHIVGSFDECLFSYAVPRLPTENNDGGFEKFERMRHLKMDGVHIEHINASSTGPLSWITRGNVDLNAVVLLPLVDAHVTSADVIKSKIAAALTDVRQSLLMSMLASDEPLSIGVRRDAEGHRQASIRPFPSLTDEFDLELLTMEKLVQRAAVWLNNDVLLPLLRSLSRSGDSAALRILDGTRSLSEAIRLQNEEIARRFVTVPADAMAVQLDIKVRNLRAQVPYRTEDLSLVHSTLIRPIVGYINEHRPGIPFSVFLTVPLTSLNGAWGFYDAGMVQQLSTEVSRTLVQAVETERRNVKNLKRVGLWSLRAISRNFLSLFDIMSDFST